jgi:hypothetical protein
VSDAPLWIVVVEHDHGTDAWACLSEEVAWSTLDEWAFVWWDQEFPDDPYPPLESIRETYFDRMAEYIKGESYIMIGPTQIVDRKWEPQRKEKTKR